MNIWLNFLIDSLAFGATFMYGSTGEILTEKAGHLNLGIPGIMCMGGAERKGVDQKAQPDIHLTASFPASFRP